MSELLLTQTAIRRAIRDVFADRRQRRIAVVAFIGKDAEAYVGDPKGLVVACWPRAGGTNPDAIAALREMGAEVFFADRLHMKLYWSPRGAVVGSANLSTNALGQGNLHELAVRIPASQVPIDAIWSDIAPRPVSPASLEKLRKEHQAYQRRNRPRAGTRDTDTFEDWYASEKRKPWALSWWDSRGPVSRRAKALATRLHAAKVENFVACKDEKVPVGRWILLGRRTDRGYFLDLEWLCVQGVVRVDRDEKRAYHVDWPFQIVQVNALKIFGPPPFKIDRTLRAAFSAWRLAAGKDEFEKRVMPDRIVSATAKFADYLHHHCKLGAK